MSDTHRQQRMWPWTRKVVCVRCGTVRRAGDWRSSLEEHRANPNACSHLFFSTRDRAGIAIGVRAGRRA